MRKRQRENQQAFFCFVSAKKKNAYGIGACLSMDVWYTWKVSLGPCRVFSELYAERLLAGAKRAVFSHSSHSSLCWSLASRDQLVSGRWCCCLCCCCVQVVFPRRRFASCLPGMLGLNKNKAPTRTRTLTLTVASSPCCLSCLPPPPPPPS